MKFGDWMNAVINFVIGALLGSAAYGLVQLVASGAWLMAAILVLLGAGLFLIMLLSDKLFDWIFPAGIWQVGKPRPQGKKPLPRRLSLPFGFVLGVALAILGLDRTILEWLP